MGGTNLSDQSALNGGTFNTYLTNDQGMAILVRCTTANIPSGKANFAIGCHLEDTTTGIHYTNTGTTTSCTFTKVSLAATGAVGYYVVAKPVNGTATVNVFGATNPFAATITGIYVVAAGTTSATITVSDTAGTVATVTTSSSQGGVTGPTSLANTSLTAGGTCTVTSSKTGDTSNVFITFTVP